MRISFQECKKAFTSPILLGLLAVFSLFNIFLILDNTYFKDELQTANELSKAYGVEITAESLQQFEQDLQKELAQFTVITGEDPEHVADFLNKLAAEADDPYTEAEHLFFQQVQRKEAYYQRAMSIDEDYAELNMIALGKATIDKYKLSGKAASIIEDAHEVLTERFEQLKQNGEHKEWFFLGKSYMLHSFLFRTLFKALIFESLLLIVLATALLTTFEFENKTHLLAYSTKRGRSLMKDKLHASLIVSASFMTALLLITLGTYFMIFDYSYLWGSSMNSALNWEYKMPYITWWKLPFWKFLLFVIIVLYSCLLLFSVITFMMATIVKNSYFTFFIFAIYFTIGILLPGFMSKAPMLLLVSVFNLPIVVMNPHMLFMGISEITMFKWHELATITIWSIILLFLYWGTTKYFRKVDI